MKINGNAILGNKTYLEAQRSEAGLMGLNGEAAWTRAHKIICPLLVRLGRQMFYRKGIFGQFLVMVKQLLKLGAI